jgi:hypothetical protein
MSGAIPPLPQYAFMAWNSVKAQGQLYLYLTCETTELYRTGSRGHVFRMADSRSVETEDLKAERTPCSWVTEGEVAGAGTGRNGPLYDY